METFPIVACRPCLQTVGMANLWTRGGLSWRELVLRTWQESWEDAVFGQAARLAFYHFIAIFPSLLLLFFALIRLPAAGSALRTTLSTALAGILPHEASGLMQMMIEKLNATASTGIGLFSAGIGALWATVNGTWAVMTGLNTAYEVKEQRPLWKVLTIAFALTVSMAVMFLIALGALFYAKNAAQDILQRAGAGASLPVLLRSIEWAMLAVLLALSFALFYRFGPNLYNRQWQWSTPGAVLALILWMLASELVRLYFERFHTYHVVYGPLEGVAMLLLWLYFTSAAILIGGEMNSEIEKATEQNSAPRKAMAHDREGN
jgi:membrane protein